MDKYGSNFALFRPLLIQRTLKDAGCLLWLDIDQRFITEDLTPFLKLAAAKSGVIVWLMEDRMIPTTAMTHPKMFTKLGVRCVEKITHQISYSD